MTCVSMTAPTDPTIDPQIDRYAAERRRLKAMSKPFINDEFMEGRPRFRGSDYRQPRLRRSTFDPKTLVFESRLGGGDDGFVWKVRFDNEGPFALKVFWDQVPPQEVGSYYPMQRECQNAAVLQMMEAAVANEPVLVYTHPFGKGDAHENYFSFCEENAISKLGIKADPKTLPSGTKLITEMPRLAQCYGWVKFPSDTLEGLPISLQATHDEPHKVRKLVGSHMDCIAIVYEFIEEGKNSLGAVEKVDNFLWFAGFAYANEPEEKSWRSNVLVDHSEIIHTRGYGWNEEDYMDRSAEQIISDEDLEHEMDPDYNSS
ncbi:hypothetical protein H0G86_000821 [Trichoderma simmonsii]|uniref:Uncharacterized protein n=1 Tax=Trichoderma simmonsii TaxID=1491479 RepID=A0A8G0L0E1_9HYPO|nr:hypothetical protein H0G86_000821 [Trichoderma simmonsii]